MSREKEAADNNVMCCALTGRERAKAQALVVQILPSASLNSRLPTCTCTKQVFLRAAVVDDNKNRKKGERDLTTTTTAREREKRREKRERLLLLLLLSCLLSADQQQLPSSLSWRSTLRAQMRWCGRGSRRGLPSLSKTHVLLLAR